MKTNCTMVLFFVLFWPMLLTSETIPTIQIEDWINIKRQEACLKPLSIEENLEESAQTYSETLFHYGILTHRDKSGQGPLERYILQGGTALAVGEILGTQSSDTPLEELLEAWWLSDTHRKQILNPRWNCFGAAWLQREGNDILVVEFSSSLLLTYEFIRTDGALSLNFTVHPGFDEIIFTHVLQKTWVNWKREDPSHIVFPADALPLLLELSSLSPDSSHKAPVANRFLYY